MTNLNLNPPADWVLCPGCQNEWNTLVNGICPDCTRLQEQSLPYPAYSFENYIDIDKKHIKLIAKLKELKCGYYLFGTTGVGKTHLAKALCNRIYKNKKTFVYIETSELLLEIRGSFRTLTTEESIISKYSDPEYVIIDDFGAEKVSDFTIETLYIIINRRSKLDNRKTLITSNLSIGQIAETLSDRIASRIAGMCDIYNITGKDWRIK